MEKASSRTPIPGFDGYFADPEGGIYTNTNTQDCPLDVDGFRRLKPSISNYGYAIYRLAREGRGVNVSGHKLVLLTFVGPPPKGMVACHYNGVRLDNRACNLRWDTPKGNSADAIRHGTTCKGEKCGQAKLNSNQVAMIRYKRNLGATLVSLAVEFGVNHSTIRRITTGRSWQCIPEGISAPQGTVAGILLGKCDGFTASPQNANTRRSFTLNTVIAEMRSRFLAPAHGADVLFV